MISLSKQEAWELTWGIKAQSNAITGIFSAKQDPTTQGQCAQEQIHHQAKR